MHTLSSASRTCIASVSAVECTATVAIPNSRQARCTRNAISPRLAISIFLNMAPTIVMVGLDPTIHAFATPQAQTKKSFLVLF
jgi:hypothetical protein